ncbi:MAG: FISUMP domain-containing protein, partial [Candidatus Zixiibacteriota bacterium]
MKSCLLTVMGICLFIAPIGLPADNCGDVNNSGGINILDVTYLISYLYKGGTAPACAETTGTATDIDGNVYHTIKIGSQWWMVENLRVTHYKNGDPIPNVTDNAEWGGLTTGAYCDYSNNACYADAFGRLYNWHAVSDERDIAPDGWHVPSDAEWQILIDYLGGSAVAGGKMKEAGFGHWTAPNTGATNECGFTGLPAGSRDDDGYFGYIYGYTDIWSSTEYSSTSA